MANINPMRYKGYYYDSDTGMYYLQSRYYDPSLKRFINADVYCDTGTGLLGTNMFAYCENNAVNMFDLGGSLSDWIVTGIIHLAFSCSNCAWLNFYSAKNAISVAANIYLINHNCPISRAMFNIALWGGLLSKDIINKMKKAFNDSSELSNKIKEIMKKQKGNSVKNLAGSVEFTKPTDLCYSVGKASLLLNGTKKSGKWNLDVKIYDTYDFDEIRTITKGITTGNLANDLGWAMQKIGMLKTFYWAVHISKKV